MEMFLHAGLVDVMLKTREEGRRQNYTTAAATTATTRAGAPANIILNISCLKYETTLSYSVYCLQGHIFF